MSLTNSDRAALVAEASRLGDPAGGGERYLLWRMAEAMREMEARLVELDRRATWHDHILEAYGTSGVGEELKGVLDRAWDDAAKGGSI